MTECVFCRTALRFHCRAGHPTCTWLTCDTKDQGCGAVIDPIGHHATRNGEVVPWPTTQPDDN